MPLFGLTPNPAALDRPEWLGSAHQGPCYVEAPDARRARLYAANAFTLTTAPRSPAGLLPASPWTRPDLAAAEPVIGLSNGTVPEGTIMVPADLDQPRGPYRVFRCG